MIWAYRILVAPTLVLALPLLSLFNRKVREGLKLRFHARPKFNFDQKPIWIHAASGEFEYAKAVIREIKLADPKQPVVVSYFSPTFAKAIANFPGVDASFPLPLDLPGPLSSWIRRLNPQRLLIARTDLWPELLTQAQIYKIPITIFSYTQSDTRGHLLRRWVRRWLLSKCDEVYCVSPKDEANVKALGAKSKVSALGDTRYDQVQFRLENPKVLPAQLKPTRPALVAGSTWSEDEAALIPACAPFLKSSEMQLILVPHEPTRSHIEQIESQLKAEGLTFSRFTSEQSWNDKHVLIVDKIGVLAELYLWADLAFVGGSYKKTVHSVMEALGAGARTFIGPYHHNNREAVEFQNIKFQEWPLVTVCPTAEDLRKALHESLQDPEKLQAYRSYLKKEFYSRLGASRRLSVRLAEL